MFGLFEFVVFVAIIFVALLIFVLIFAIADGHKEKIAKYIRQHGGSNAQIQERFFDFDKSTRTYDVTFYSPEGMHYQTVCKIKWYDTKLYWSKAPETLLSNTITQPRPSPNSKEATITQLYAENEALREEIKRLKN